MIQAKLITYLAVILFVSCLAIFVISPTRAAAADGVPEGFESYRDRPSILEVPAEPQEIEGNWKLIRNAHIHFVAVLLELYQNDDIYFLARDAEYLFDVATLATVGDPLAERIHLINVSRGNVEDPKLREYLGENGISEENLMSGKRVVLVDSGVRGAVIEQIRSLFSKQASKNLRGQLTDSFNFRFPSSRTFLLYAGENLNETSFGLVSYENLAHYTDTSTGYLRLKDGIHPISAVTTGPENVSKRKAIALMKDLKAFWNRRSTRESFLQERQQTRKLVSSLSSGDRKKAIKAVEEQLWGQSLGGFEHREALVRDVLEAQPNLGISIPISLDEIGFKMDDRSLRAKRYNKPEYTLDLAKCIESLAAVVAP